MAVEDLSWITERYLATAIRGIAAERPEQRNAQNVYKTCCVYDDGAGGRCLIGQFLHNEGVDTSELRPSEGAAEVLSDLEVFDRFVRDVAVDVQHVADGGFENSVENPLPVWSQVVADLTRAEVL